MFPHINGFQGLEPSKIPRYPPHETLSWLIGFPCFVHFIAQSAGVSDRRALHSNELPSTVGGREEAVPGAMEIRMKPTKTEIYLCTYYICIIHSRI
jgi:hypothetical protein